MNHFKLINNIKLMTFTLIYFTCYVMRFVLNDHILFLILPSFILNAVKMYKYALKINKITSNVQNGLKIEKQCIYSYIKKNEYFTV